MQAANTQNLRSLKEDAGAFAPPQDALMLQNVVQEEERHVDETYQRNHVVKNAAERERQLELQRAAEARARPRTTVKIPQHKVRGVEAVMLQVNRDKCSYSKLMTYQMQDREFIQNFSKRADNLQHAEVLRVHPLGDSADADAGQKKRASASQSLLRGTQSSRLKSVSNTEGVKPRQEIVREKLRNKVPLRVKFAPQRGAGKALKSLLKSKISTHLPSGEITSRKQAPIHYIKHSEAKIPRQLVERMDDGPGAQPQAAQRKGITIKKIRSTVKAKSKRRSSYAKIESNLNAQCEQMQLGGPSRPVNLFLNQDLPPRPSLLKQNSMPAGSILKNARPRIEAIP